MYLTTGGRRLAMRHARVGGNVGRPSRVGPDADGHLVNLVWPRDNDWHSISRVPGRDSAPGGGWLRRSGQRQARRQGTEASEISRAMIRTEGDLAKSSVANLHFCTLGTNASGHSWVLGRRRSGGNPFRPDVVQPPLLPDSTLSRPRANNGCWCCCSPVRPSGPQSGSMASRLERTNQGPVAFQVQGSC